jgi:hypothetical protein
MKVVCEHCGLPFSVPRAVPGKAVYCCSGCALASRVPVDAQGQFPVNAALVSALGGGFVFFNQALFWMLAVLLERRADAGSVIYAGRFAIASLMLGVAVWLAVMFFQWNAGALRAPDKAMLGVSGTALGWAFSHGRPELALLGNLILAAWALRGLARRKVSEKNRTKEAAGS